MSHPGQINTMPRVLDFNNGTPEKWGMPDARSLITFLFSARRKLIF